MAVAGRRMNGDAGPSKNKMTWKKVKETIQLEGEL